MTKPAWERKNDALVAIRECLRPADIKTLAELLSAVREEHRDEMEGAETQAELWRAQGAVRAVSAISGLIETEVMQHGGRI
jgi:hypothetical protein